MFLKDNMKAFIDSHGFAENTRAQYMRMLSAIGTYESKIEEPLYRMSPDDMYRGFSVVSKNADRIRKLRSLVEKYFDWLSESGVDVSIGRKSLLEIKKKSVEHISTLQYFYSIHHLIAKTHNDIQYVSGVEDKNPTDYRMLRSAFILAWYGIKLDDVLLVEKNDILRNPGFITFGGKIIEVDSAAYEVLSECATAQEYSKGNGSCLVSVGYCNTQRLFRTNVKQMDIRSIRESITLFNVKLRGKSTPYNVNKIYWSGLFYRAYIYEKNGGLEGVPEKAQQKAFEKLFGETYSTKQQYYGRQQEFRLYKSVFGKEK